MTAFWLENNVVLVVVLVALHEHELAQNARASTARVLDFATRIRFAIHIHIMWKTDADPVPAEPIPSNDGLVNAEDLGGREVLAAMGIDCLNKIIDE